MALPTTGAISFSQVQAQYGGANPISMSEYYRKTDNSGYVKHTGYEMSPSMYSLTAPWYSWSVLPSWSVAFIVWTGGINAEVPDTWISYTSGGYTYYRDTFVVNQHDMDYYRIKRSQPNAPKNQSVPTSGQISLSQFRGGTN